LYNNIRKEILIPYDPKKNKWVNTTRKLNKERQWQEKDASKMSDKDLLKDAWKLYYNNKRKEKNNT
jgi:hypothetical protein|tara:strand:- start:1952 stop:2149 length:198 start_codon:yes stop_codon:yes gene_type:complete